MAPAVEKAEAPTAPNPLTIKHKIVNCVSFWTCSSAPNKRLQLPQRNTPVFFFKEKILDFTQFVHYLFTYNLYSPVININLGPIDGVIWPKMGDVQNTTAGWMLKIRPTNELIKWWQNVLCNMVITLVP